MPFRIPDRYTNCLVMSSDAGPITTASYIEWLKRELLLAETYLAALPPPPPAENKEGE